MSVKEDAAYQEWLAKVKEQFPEEAQQKLDEIAALDATKEVFFRGTIRKDEFHRRLNEVSKKEKELEAEQEIVRKWYYNDALPEYESKVKENAELQARLKSMESQVKALNLEDVVTLPKPDDVKKAVASSDEDEISKLRNRLDAVDKIFPVVLAQMSTVTKKIVSEKWDVEPEAVLQHALKEHISPTQAFDFLIGEQKGKREEEKLKKLEKDAYDRGMKEALSKTPNPDRVRPSGPTVFDALVKKEAPKEQFERVNAAIQHFTSLGESDLPV